MREGEYIVWNIALFCPAPFFVCRKIVLESAFCVCCQRCMRWKRACAAFSLCSTISRQLQAKGDRGWQLLNVVKSTWANECQNHYISICTVAHMRRTKSIIFFFIFRHLHFILLQFSSFTFPKSRQISKSVAKMRGTGARWGRGRHLLMDTSLSAPHSSL